MTDVSKLYPREYTSWESLRVRCLTRTRPQFKDYGGRGIAVCNTWDDFHQFLRDMGPRPPKTSIDRIDNSLGYFPGNCRWADSRTQARNTRRTRLNTEAVKVIRVCRRSNVSVTKLSAYYSVDEATISNISSGRSWKDVIAPILPEYRSLKMNSEAVKVIRFLRARGILGVKLAAYYNTTPQNVSIIFRGVNWKDVYK